MARANFLQPARASLVGDWADLIRQEFPEETVGIDLSAFADGHIKGYSVTSEIFANMAEAKQITYDAWQRVFVMGRAGVDEMDRACQRIESLQTGKE
jgi:hypothetical protein